VNNWLRKVLTNKPKAYKVSLFSLPIVVMCAVVSDLSFRYSESAVGLDVFLPILFGLVFMILGYLACITSFVSGLSVVKSFKHSLLWLIPEGILLLVPLIIISITYYNSHFDRGPIEGYNKAIEINQRDALTYYNRGVVKGSLGEYRGAIEEYNKAIEINPNFTEAYFNRGIIKGELGDYRGAIEEYNKAIEINPKLAEAYYGRGFAKGGLSDYRGAIEDYNKAIKINPKDATAYYNRGTIKGKLGDYRGALKDYNEAINKNPKYAEAYYNSGLAKIEWGEKKRGCLDLSRAGELGFDKAYEAIKVYCN